MIIFQNGYSCEDKLRLFGNLFFNKDEDVILYSNFTYEKESINVYTSIVYKEQTYFDDLSMSFPKSTDSFSDYQKLRRKAFDSCVTKGFCSTAGQIKKINLPWGVMSGIRPAKNVRELIDGGLSTNQVLDTLYNFYNVSPEKADLAMTVAANELEILKTNKKNSVSLYIGIPFCPSRCLYCSFVSTDIRVSGKYMDEYVDLLIKEIKKTSEVINALGLFVDNIYIGGGTPTTLSPMHLTKIFEALNKWIILDRLREFTVEAGRPDTIDREKLMSLKKGGVNRISINPQTMNDFTLKRIGRTHSVELVKKAMHLAREIGFSNINMDLIAGLPGENLGDFCHSVDEVINLDPENITIHCMCVKRSATLNFLGAKLTSADVMNDMLSYAQRRMKETGRLPYYMYRQKNISGNLENVGYAKPGFMSFYNINIMEEVQTILALGCSASTKLVMGERIERIFNFKDPVEYINRFDEILSRKDEALRLLRRN